MIIDQSLQESVDGTSRTFGVVTWGFNDILERGGEFSKIAAVTVSKEREWLVSALTENLVQDVLHL